MNEQDPLRLAARDADDLAVIAAVAQDALVPIGEMTYLPAEQRFVIVLNRFRWDRVAQDAEESTPVNRRPTPERDAPFWDASDRAPPYERILAGLRFERVTGVKTHGIDFRNRDRILELLTITSEPGVILLVFAGDVAIRLDVAELHCLIEDFGDSWPTRSRPRHPEVERKSPSK